MKALFASLLTILFCHVSAEEPVNLTCTELNNTFFGSAFYVFSSTPTYNGSDYYLQSKNNEEGVKVGVNNWSALNSKGFDPSRKTVFIIHGYIAHRKKPYIIEMTKQLLDTNNINLIVIDWSKGSKTWNYINAVQTTYHVAQDLVKFLQTMKEEVAKLNKPASEEWKNLYLIGHSLGAHISGQTGYLLKQRDQSFKVERITGLDPAQPCFISVEQNARLDKSDADFVDIIHTQTGHGNGINAFGLENPVGHIDFYVNGGVMQPECEAKSIFYTEINKMICSHNLANYFYAETAGYSKSKYCKFVGRSWDGSYSDAVRILDDVEKGSSCSNCPEMGLNAINYKKNTGKYLVITSTKKPYCQLKTDDKDKLIKGFGRLNTTTVLFPASTFDPETMFEDWLS
ncbi:pancreatic lipase-related protein 2-like [Nasonia vitripennis]|uniref:phospholipase A1 n=1 Tax=Nasonia vitripennis TaxID=7425 RepID=A0A7M7IP01_NASVI|nr:pancreatic lipase-related protein 2-like [Nasonia vitripennis]XP_031780296.1 pancreatic lipase-related protein 2-like [Nasonia vitripennis]